MKREIAKPDLAQTMWDAYRAQSCDTSHAGKLPPNWDELEPGTRSGWEAAALAATSALIGNFVANGAGRYSCDCLIPCGVKACPGWEPQHGLLSSIKAHDSCAD
jgi:hypothetical protein